MSEATRRKLIKTALEMNTRGINQGTAGNLSIRHNGGMLITPSGMAYASLKTADIVFVDASGVHNGERLPSSEWRIHHDIYQARPDAGAILHAHPTDCAALACLHLAIPAFHYMVAVAGGHDIRCAPYATFGTQELSDNVLEALHERMACLMANHGVICLADGLSRALSLAIEVEHLARTYRHCLSIGSPVVLDEEEMDRVLLKFRSYGVSQD
jgi:L-fuculose-phosphate aldolase